MLLVLAACGGGGGGGGGDDPPTPPAENDPPVVDAGDDVSISLPDATVSLAGSATDDGPASALTYEWTSSDADATTFSAADAAATDATFSAAGEYTLTLSVSDGTQTASDTVVVTVNEEPSAAEVWPADDTDETNPLHGWAKVDAEDVGMTQQGLEDAADFAQTVPTGVEPGAGMIVRNGQLVHFWGDIDEQQPVKSVTKSMGGVVLGLAIDENRVALEDKGVDYIPTFGTPPDENASAGATEITLAQLATHTAGFDKDGGFVALQFEPGTHWRYSDGGLNWLADVLTTVYQQDLSEVATTNVWSKLGVSNDDITWREADKRPSTRDGGTLQYRELASGINANVNAMARVGLLFLRKGMWKDQRIISESFVELVQTPLPENASLELFEPPNQHFPGALTDYGVLWWTNRSGLMANVPRDAFWAWGLGEALIVVIPSLDLVIARNGGQSTTNTSGRTWNEFGWDGDVHVLEPFLDPIIQATTP